MGFQSEKQIVLEFYERVENSTVNSVTDVLSKYYSENVFWRGFHPFNEVIGSRKVSDVFLGNSVNK